MKLENPDLKNTNMSKPIKSMGWVRRIQESHPINQWVLLSDQSIKEPLLALSIFIMRLVDECAVLEILTRTRHN